MSNEDAIRESLENTKKIEALKADIKLLDGKCSELKNDMDYLKERQTRQEGYIVDLFNEVKDHRLDTIKVTANLNESINQKISSVKDDLTKTIQDVSTSINKKLDDREKESKEFQIQTVQKLAVLMFGLSICVGFLNYILSI